MQATIQFRAETWVMSPRIGMILRRFHHRLAFRMAKIQPRQDMTGSWVYPLLDGGIRQVLTWGRRRWIRKWRKGSIGKGRTTWRGWRRLDR